MYNAWFAGTAAYGTPEFRSGASLFAALKQGGRWFVVADFDGRIRGWRFPHTEQVDFAELARSTRASAGSETSTTHDPAPTNLGTSTALTSELGTPWQGPAPKEWSTSLDSGAYQAAVARTREHVADGTVYQANICRVMSAPLARPQHPFALSSKLASGNPAPFAGFIHVDSDISDERVWLSSASPELFIRVTHAQGTTRVESSPIKGTAPTAQGLTEKDEAENVMITDLVRNDLSPVCVPGSIAVRDFLAVEHHPGLVHLVSTVEGEVIPELVATKELWERLFAAAYPPGSVSGAPKSSALRIIKELETHPRGPYCGTFGWIDADAGTAELAVGIRTFWWDDECCPQPSLHFGTGAGITWGSDPAREWAETELKAARLVGIASGQKPASIGSTANTASTASYEQEQGRQ